jgi:hypothetical protein
MILYVCETFSLTLKEEQRLRLCGNRVLRRIFGMKRDEVIASWRELHNEELHNLYSPKSMSTIRESERSSPRECDMDGGEEE